MGNCCVKDTKGNKQKSKSQYNNNFQSKRQDYYEDIRDELGNRDSVPGGQNNNPNSYKTKEQIQQEKSKNVFQNGQGISLGGGGNGQAQNQQHNGDDMTQSQRRLQVQEAAEKRQQQHNNRGVSDPYELEWKQKKQEQIQQYQQENAQNGNQPRLHWD